MTEGLIFHICRRPDWDAARAAGLYGGSDQDRRDGFIHFSSAGQIRASAARHHAGPGGAGRDGLVLLTVEAASLGAALRWEPSRGGALFPHLHGPLPVAAVVRVDPLPVMPDGRHGFPDDLDLAPPP
jgi:uncharacterized protein (DUF952 family)